MTNSNDHTVRVSSGKYTFVNRHAEARIDVLRNGQPWVDDAVPAAAISDMMCELDAARLVVQAARKLSDAFEMTPIDVLRQLAKSEESVGLVRALSTHDALVDDREPPSAWCGEATTAAIEQDPGYLSDLRLAEIGRRAESAVDRVDLMTSINSRDLQLMVGELQRRRSASGKE